MKLVFLSIKHSFVSPDGFHFTEEPDPRLKKSIRVKQVISPVITFTNSQKRKYLH